MEGQKEGNTVDRSPGSEGGDPEDSTGSTPERRSRWTVEGQAKGGAEVTVGSRAAARSVLRTTPYEALMEMMQGSSDRAETSSRQEGTHS